MGTKDSDIVTRLDRCAIEAGSVPASDLMDEAAAEIERLRKAPCPHVVGTTTQYCSLTPFTLTDEERFVLREVRDIYADEDDVKCNEIAAVLDGLLERMK
jgi:hypothetical protein